jgi:hypothetical protein
MLVRFREIGVWGGEISKFHEITFHIEISLM